MKRKAQIITVASTKGGVGKSTTCLACAHILACAGYKVLLMDADENMSATTRNGYNADDVEEYTNIYPLLYCRDLENKENVMKYIISSRTNNGLDLIPATEDVLKKLNPLMITQKETDSDTDLYLKKNLGYILDEYDYIFIDTHANIDETTTAVLLACDKIFGCAEPNKSSIIGVRKIQKHLEEIHLLYGVKKQIDATLITKMNLNQVDNKRFLEAFKQQDSLRPIENPIRNTKTPSEADNRNMSIYTRNKNDKTCTDYIYFLSRTELMDKKHFQIFREAHSNRRVKH